MDYKKEYEKAVNRAKWVLNTDLDYDGKWAVTNIFPEIKEIEDEKIRKKIIDHLRNGTALSFDDNKQAIYWLEEQKSNNSACIQEKMYEWLRCNLFNYTRISDIMYTELLNDLKEYMNS